VPRTPFWSVRRWLAAPARPVRRRSKLALTNLEDRSVPAITGATFAGGVLTITADGADDTIEVVLVGTSSVRVLEGQAQTERAVTGGPVSVAGMTQIVINAGAGSDTVIVDNRLREPATINGEAGADNLTGGGGHDTINTGGGVEFETANGQSGNDTITGGAGDDLLLGGLGNDQITGLGGTNNLQGGAGNDTLVGGTGIDDIAGNAGHDSIVGGSGDDRLRGDDNFGPAGNDSINGGAGADQISGGNGNDQLDGGVGNDRVEGGFGNDLIVGGPATVVGDTDADQIFGGVGNDTLEGGADNDALFGEAGKDSLVGGAGMDSLSGGLNRDFFVGHGNAPGNPADAANFDTYKDEFDLTRPIFTRAEPKDLATTELGIHDALAGFASVSNAQADFNIAGRIRYLGSGEYLVKLGTADPGGDDPNNPFPGGWVPVSFNGTWTDNDPRPSAQERFLAPTLLTEMREFWSVLVHRAVAQAVAPGYDPFVHYTQPQYEALDDLADNKLTNPGGVIEVLTGRAATEFDLTSGAPAGFGFADIVSLLRAPFWLTAEARTNAPEAGIVDGQAYAIVRAFIANGQNYITLYNPSGRDTGQTGQTLDQNVAVGRDDGFITLREDVFYANFATAYVN
jgi:Ca2+-binding RTX toxin-like protein